MKPFYANTQAKVNAAAKPKLSEKDMEAWRRFRKWKAELISSFNRETRVEKVADGSYLFVLPPRIIKETWAAICQEKLKMEIAEHGEQGAKERAEQRIRLELDAHMGHLLGIFPMPVQAATQPSPETPAELPTAEPSVLPDNPSIDVDQDPTIETPVVPAPLVEELLEENILPMDSEALEVEEP